MSKFKGTKRRRGSGNYRNKAKSKKEAFVDEEIVNHPKVRQVQLIGSDKNNLGTKSPDEALEIAQAEGLNLVCENIEVKLPVCRVLDYGKYRFEKQKKAKQTSKMQTKLILKEYRISVITSNHDISYRVESIKEALNKGHHVKLVIKLFGRFLGIENAGIDLVEKIKGLLGEDIMEISKDPTRNGKRVEVHFSPSKAVLQRIKLGNLAQKKAMKEQNNKNNNKINDSEVNVPQKEENDNKEI